MSAPIIFTRGARQYEIRRDAELGYVGYVDGEPTIAAAEASITARLLIDSHTRVGLTRRLPSSAGVPKLSHFVLRAGDGELGPVG